MNILDTSSLTLQTYSKIWNKKPANFLKYFRGSTAAKILHNLHACKFNGAWLQKEHAQRPDCSRHDSSRNNWKSFPRVPGALPPHRQPDVERLNDQSLSGVLCSRFDVRLHHVTYYDSGTAHEPGRPRALHAERSRRHPDVHLSLDTHPQVRRPSPHFYLAHFAACLLLHPGFLPMTSAT